MILNITKLHQHLHITFSFGYHHDQHQLIFMNRVTSINDDDCTLIDIHFKYIDYIILTARHSEFLQIFDVYFYSKGKHLSILVSFVTVK